MKDTFTNKHKCHIVNIINVNQHYIVVVLFKPRASFRLGFRLESRPCGRYNKHVCGRAENVKTQFHHLVFTGGSLTSISMRMRSQQRVDAWLATLGTASVSPWWRYFTCLGALRESTTPGLVTAAWFFSTPANASLYSEWFHLRRTQFNDIHLHA